MSYDALQRWLIDHTPLDPALLEGSSFTSLIDHRIAQLGLQDTHEYLRLLEHTPAESHWFISCIAVPETWFFRYPHSFRCLSDALSRRLALGDRSLTIASVGCATGEEPYTIAMVARHAGWSPDALTIHALDCSQSALERAAAARYPAASFRSEIPAWAADFFRHEPDGVAVAPEIRAMVRFTSLDITSPFEQLPAPAFDVIFCRNVLIYLHAKARAFLLDRLFHSLAPGGLFFVGHAEPLLCLRPGLAVVPVEHAFCLQRIDTPAPGAAFPSFATTADRPPPRIVDRPQVPARSSPGFRDAPPSRPSSPPPPLHQPPTSILQSPPPSLPPAALMLEEARTLADAGQNAQCEALLRRIIDTPEPPAEALELLGLLRMSAGDPAQARGFFERALYLDPARAASILQLAMIYERGGDQRRADAYWNRASRLSAGPGSPS